MQALFHEPSLSWCFPFLQLRPQTQWMLLRENMSCGLFVPLEVFWLCYTTAHHSKVTQTAGALREINLAFTFIKIQIFSFHQWKTWGDDNFVETHQSTAWKGPDWADSDHKSQAGGISGLFPVPSLISWGLFSLRCRMLSDKHAAFPLEAGNSIQVFLFLVLWFMCRAGGCFHKLLNQLWKKPRNSWAQKSLSVRAVITIIK